MSSQLIDLIGDDADGNDSDAHPLTESDTGSRVAAANDTDSLNSDIDLNEVNEAEFSDDGEDSMSFTTVVPLQSVLKEPNEYRSERHSWRNAEWTLLVRWKPLNNSIIPPKSLGVFLALHDMHKLPKNWKLSFKFCFTLLSEDGLDNIDKGTSPYFGCNNKLQEYTHAFAQTDSNYTDVGFNQTFSLELLEKEKYVRDGCIHIRVTAEYLPNPFRPPAHYNSKVATDMVGLCNLGATCYLNALLQMLFHINAFRRAVYALPFEDQDFKESTTLALQSVFRGLQCDRVEVTTSDLTRAFGWNTYESFQQQDVQEMLRVLLDKLEEKMKGTSVDGVVGQLFAGKVKSYIRCINVDRVSEREEDFYDIQLDVKGCADIYESFRRYTAKEMLQGENQYDAEGIGKQDAEKGVTFTKLPPVLTIHLKRFEFDMQRMGFAKIHDHYAFPLRLDLNEFVSTMDTDSENPKDNNIFQLHSVLVHAGDVYGGHYFAYIRPSVDEFWQCIHLGSEPPRVNGKWFKFDDEIVSRAHRKEAVEMCYGRSGDDRLSFSSAYMLVYIRETEAAKIMAPVVQEDIPEALQDRILIERRKQQQEMYLHTLEESYYVMHYVTEAELRRFRKFSEKDDLIDRKRHVREIRGIRGAKLIGMLLRLSRELGVDIGSIRFWTCYDRDDVIRIDECIKYRDMLKSFHRQVLYFVESVATSGSLPEDVKEEWEADWNNFLQREKKWREKVLTALYEYEGEGIDRSSSFGMGDGTFHLNGLPPHIKEKLCQEMNVHLEFLLEALEKRASRLYSDSDGILILKLFDRNNSFPDTQEPRNAPRLIYYSYLRINFGESMSRVYDTFDDYIATVFQVSDLAIPESWLDYELVEIEAPTRCRVYNRDKVENISLSDCQLISGDMLCAQQGPESESEDEDSSVVDVTMGNVQAFLLQQAWQIKANVIPFSLRDASILQRKTGLWRYKPEDPSYEPCTHVMKVTISLEMSMREVVRRISEELSFTEPDRLHLYASALSLNGERSIPVCISKDSSVKLRNALPYSVDSNHILSLQYRIFPFPVKSASNSSERYFELHLIGKALRDMRASVVTSVLLPLFAEAVDRYLRVEPDAEPIEMPFFYRIFKVPTAMQDVPEEFIIEDYLYLAMDVFGNTLVHDLATMIRWNLGMPTLKVFDVPFEDTVNTHDGHERGAKRRLLDISDESKSDVELLLQPNSQHTHTCALSSVAIIADEPKLKLQHERYGLSSSELVSEEDEAKDQLLISVCRGQSILTPLRPLQAVTSLPSSWMDIAINNGLAHQNIVVQLVSQEDLLYMNNCHPSGVQSIPISVTGYELFGSSCRFRGMRNGPFLSYLRSDDTYDTLAERLGAFSDNDDWAQFRLSVIRDRIPYILPRTPSPFNDNNAFQDTSSNVWEEVEKHYPNVSKWTANSESFHNVTNVGSRYFAIIGIQQSAQSSDGMGSTRTRRGGGGITIRG